VKKSIFGIVPSGKTHRFIKDRRGSSAVEFALIVPIFFALTFSIIEAGWFFFVNSAVDAATAKASRLVRTGQVQAGRFDRDTFFDEVCNVVDLFGDCGSQLTVDVQRFSDFTTLAADIASPVCRNAAPADVSGIPFQAGAPRDIVRVRVCYLHKTINPGLGLQLEEADGSTKKMIATSIFRNEPFNN